MNLRLLALLSAATALAACQPPADASSPSPEPAPATPPATTAAAPSPSPSTSPADAPPSAIAQPTSPPAAPAEPAPGTPEALAGALLTKGGITYSASKKAFLFAVGWNQEGTGAGTRIEILGEDGKREQIDVCEPGECEEKEAELQTTHGPMIAARLRDGGYVPVTGISWPDDKTELDVPALGKKLRFKKDHIEIAGGKKPVVLAKLKFSAPHKAEPSYVAVAPDKSLFAVGYTFDPGSKYGEGFNVYTEVHVYRVP